MSYNDDDDVNFNELVKESLGELDTLLNGEEELEEDFLSEDEELDDYCLLSLTEEEVTELREELAIDNDEMEEMLEAVVKRVNSRGQVSRTKDSTTRKRQATRTTGMSKTDRKRRAKKAARTRKKSPGKLRKAVKKRNKAMKRRRQLSLS